MITIKQTSNERYLTVVEHLLEEMRIGEIPWNKPWFCRLPTNYETKKSYTGINIINLNMIAKRVGYESHYWLTKKQAENCGGRIRDDQINSPHYIIMAKWQSRQWHDKHGNENVKCWLMIRTYEVYNFEQTRNIPYASDSINYDLFGIGVTADSVTKMYKDPPRIIFDNDRAFYKPFSDCIGIPKPNQFLSSEEYYSTLFHELIHSTGHSKRLDRHSFKDTLLDPKESYAKEELVAELGSAFLSCYCGFFSQTKKNSSAYLSSWLKVLKSDNTFLFRAATNAQRAVNYILNEKEQCSEAELTLFDNVYNEIQMDNFANQQWI